MERKELRDIAIASIVLGIAFAGFFTRGGILGLIGNPSLVPKALIIAFVIVPISFVAHEMGHRYLARKYHCYAEFKMWTLGLVLALITGLTGFILFAAPGAVYIHQRMDYWGNRIPLTVKKNGLISLIGPAINLVLAILFYSLFFVLSPTGLLSEIINIGFRMNLILAMFNMVPFPPLDGSKVFAWNKAVWGVFFIPLAILLFF